MIPQIKSFISLYKKDFQIISDFYTLLTEDQYDFRLVNTDNRKSDSPRESFAHILEITLAYLEGLKTENLVFQNTKREHYYKMSKNELLAESIKINEELFSYISSDSFDSTKIVTAPWGKTPSITLLFAMREHLILHQGWNLALMDVLNMPRFDSLKKTWGE